MQDDSVVDLFLCHGSPDKRWVEDLASQIESETFDGTANGRPLRVFLDKWDIDKGQNFLDRMDEGLGRARYVAVVLSPALLNAPFAKMEWQHALIQDPTNRRRRLLPLLIEDYDAVSGDRISLPAPFLALNWIDFRGHTRFVSGVRDLVRCLRDQPPARGRKRLPLAGASTQGVTSPIDTAIPVGPDQTDELIFSNLLEIPDHPGTIWSASTPLRTHAEVRTALGDVPPHILREGRLFTFVDLASPSNVFAEILESGTVRSERSNDWLMHPDRARWFVQLINHAMSAHLRQFPVRFSRDHGVYFFLPRNGQDRKWRNGHDRARTVAAKKNRHGSDLVFWIHHAVRLRATIVGSRPWFSLEPTYGFSKDGSDLAKAEWVGDLKRKWGGKERNAAVLRHILFWSRTLANGGMKIALDVGGPVVQVAPLPALASAQFGLLNDQVRIRTLLAEDPDELDHAIELAEFEEEA